MFPTEQQPGRALRMARPWLAGGGVLGLLLLGVGGAALAQSPAPEQPGPAAAPGLSKPDIMAVVMSHKPAIKECMKTHWQKEPDVSGRMVMRWTIQTDGRTKDVSCVPGALCPTYLVSCLTGLIQGWTFPAHSVQGEPIDFPFTF